jgi:hypothetical protein
LLFIYGLQECLGFAVGAWFHQQRVVTTSHFNLLEKVYFVACSGTVILIFNNGQFI